MDRGFWAVNEKAFTSSVFPELFQGFARGAFLRNISLLSINMKASWRASFLKSRERANQCNNSGKTEEVVGDEAILFYIPSS